MLDWNRLEVGFERFLELLARDARAQAEFEASRAQFFVPGVAQGAQAERRHLEWFLLERPSDALGGIPVLAWQEGWRQSLAEPRAEVVAAFLESLPGAFELTSLVQGEGLWMRDLFTQGEHPVVAARASGELVVGDLLVGRLFPAGGGVYLLSPAVTVFRNPPLLQAVRRDLEAMRRARRGVLRIQQLELEHLFHAGVLEAHARPSLAEGRARARAALRELGLEGPVLESVLARLTRGARAAESRTVVELLNELAFDTPVELSSARLVLAELWDLERSAPAGEAEASANDAQAALAAFDAGRAQGKDLEQLFRELERDLGLEDEGGEEAEDPGAPDFPGVVGAMVEEFLWEVGREEGAERARELDILRLFGTYAADLGVFEELGPVRLLDFCARWLLDESPVRTPEEATRVLEALGAFCRWAEERHDLALWKDFGPTLGELQQSVPRHVRLRPLVARPAGTQTYEVVAVGGGAAELRARNGDGTRLELTAEQEALLRPGDLVRLGKNARELGASYPPELARYGA